MTMTTDKPTAKRRMAREPKTTSAAATPENTTATSRLDQLEALLMREHGATIAEMVDATGWQQHSVRGAMAGALKKKRGLVITSEKIGGVRRYRASKPA